MTQVRFGDAIVVVERSWADFRKVVDGTEKTLLIQGEYVNDREWMLFALDGILLYTTTIYDPGFEPIGYTPEQIQANTDAATDFNDNFASMANGQVATRLRADGVAYFVPKSSSIDYEMCNRDFRLRTAAFDSVAAVSLPNGADGTLTFLAAISGEAGNLVSIEIEEGETGLLHANRALAVSNSGYAVKVTFGTNGLGASVVPTAGQIATLINSTPSIAAFFLVAVASGDGSSPAITTAPLSLAGGALSSCEDLMVNVATNKEESWNEITLKGVYKDVGGVMVPCTDQADATANAVLSVWDYVARNHTTGDLIKYEILEGILSCDPSVPANERWDHRVYAVAAPLIPASMGGQVRIFDGYSRAADDYSIKAKNQQARHLDPDLAPGASTLRVYLYYPAGTAFEHVLRLVTFRPPQTT